MANFFDQFDSGASAGASSSNFFDQFDEGSQQPANNEGNFTRGLKNSFRQLPQLGYGIEAIAGATGEKLAGEGGLFTGLKQHGIKNYQREAEELAPFSKENDSISTAWEKAKGGDIGALGDFGGYGLGYVTGQGAQALATAGVGKLLAQQGVKAVAPSIIEAVTAKEAAKLAGKGLAESEVQQIAAKNALAKIGTYGANTALAANALGMEGGEIGGGMVANAEQRGTPLTGEELVKGGLSTLGAGALEYLGDKIGIDAAFGKMPIGKALSEAPGVSGRVGRGLVGGAMAAVPEAGTEYGQTMLEQYGQGQDPFSAESQRQAIDAAALGALGGQVMGGAGGLVSSAQPKIVEKPISDGPLGNAAAAGGITQTEISDAGTTNQEALIPEQNLGGSSGAVLPASNGLGEPNDAMPEPESLVDQTGAATTGNEAESALATQQAPSPVDFQPTHLADDGTPVAYRKDDQGPYFETADGQQWDYTDTATPITQEVQNANSPTGSVAENNPPITVQDSGIGSDQRGFDTSLEPTDGRADDRGISGADGQLRGAESPSDVESGGTLSPSSIVNTQYLTDNGVTESDISRIDQALNNNPGLAQKPLGFIRGFLKDKYQGLDYSQVIQDVSTQQSPASSLDATTTQSQPDAGLVSSQLGNLNAQTPETQPVLPNTGANQTGNASTVGAGQGQSAVSGQEEVGAPSYQTAVDAQFTQKSYDAPTKALGGMTPREYGKQHVEAGHQFVEKDGKYYLKGDGAGMKQIPKATYLYGSALEKAARESGDYVASETTQSTPQAIHIEGQGIERVTPSVVSNAMQKAAERKHTSKTQMREWLVGEIDKAIAQADSYMERGLSDPEIGDNGKPTGKRLPSNQAARELGHKVFDVPGDGTFKVLNARENLEAFKNKVLASSGFKETRDAKGTRQPSQAQADALRMAEKYIREGEHDFAGQILANAGIDAAAVDSVLSKFKPEAANAVRQSMVSEPLETQPTAETTTPLFDKLDRAKGIVSVTHKAIKDHPNAERIAMIHNRFNDVLNDHGFEPAHNINGNLTNRIRITC